MNYNHYIVIMAEPNCKPDDILDILNKHTEFGKWEYTIQSHPIRGGEQWWFRLTSTTGFSSYEIADIIFDIRYRLDYEPWHIALNNVGDYEVQP